MKQLTPYQNVQSARRSLDNGGRFYNLMAEASDELVDPGELARAAGVFSAGATAFLFMEMALQALPKQKQAEVEAMLSPELQHKLAEQRPLVLQPSAVEQHGLSGKTAIVTGYPMFVEDREQFSGMIVMVVPVVMFIPLVDQFDVYEVYDTPDLREPRTVIATTRGFKRLVPALTRFGGTLKQLEFEDRTGKEHGLYLETAFYTLLD